MEIDRQIEKEDESSQDNIFPESRAYLFTKFGQAEELREFHLKRSIDVIPSLLSISIILTSLCLKYISTNSL